LALSYSWGEQPTLVPFVVGSHQDFLISLDLHYALRNLRHGHQPCYVWIDTICINQADIAERNSQVKIMREVYARAKSVCIWLGMPPSSAGDLTGARIQDIKYDVVQHIASKGARNWWRRLWIVQEAAAATVEPVVLLGDLRLPWKAFIRHCISFNMRLKHSEIDRDTVEEISMLSMIRNTRMTFRDVKYTCDLEFLLRTTVDFHTSDPHDTIYAVLGLADDAAKQAVRVDYGMPIVDLYAEVTQRLVEAPSRRLNDPLNVVIGRCWQQLFLAGPSWIIDFSRRSTHSASWIQFDNATMHKSYSIPTIADARADNDAALQGMAPSNEQHFPTRKGPSQTNTTTHSCHRFVPPANEENLRASFDKDLRTMTCSGMAVGVVSNIVHVCKHLLSIKTESQPATVDESAISVELQCSESKLASAFRWFEDVHPRHLCSVDQMAVFVTEDGDIGICYGTMKDGRSGLDASSAFVKAGDHVMCLYGASEHILVQTGVGDLGKNCCLLLPCIFMCDCECFAGQTHPIEVFERMTFV
jgi:hypothetical protein